MPRSTDFQSQRRGFFKLGAGAVALAALAKIGVARPGPAASPAAAAATRYKTVNVQGLQIFYREAGPVDAPVVLLLHGFPTSSHMYRNLMPLLADRYRVIAPDYPAFGHSEVPSRERFSYTHAHLADVMDGVLSALQIGSFAMYVMDFGGPIGYRLMLKYPDRVRGVIIQNTPVFGEPQDGPVWGPLFTYWKQPTPAHRDVLRPGLSLAAIREQYVAGTRDPSLIDPDNWTLDSALISRPGVDEIMLDLLYDIRNNRETVQNARAFFGSHQDRVVIATGVNDPLFPGSIMRPPASMPNIAFHSIDSGHFALEDHAAEIATISRGFLAKVLPA